MIAYESIPHLRHCMINGQLVHCFKKYDGSNLRFEWQRKKGFCKFGSRTRLIGPDDEIFSEGIELFMDTMAEDIERRLRDFLGAKAFGNLDRATTFAEFFGPSSFAGTHDPLEEHCLRLFDVHLRLQGLIGPREFLEAFGAAAYCSELTAVRNLNAELIEEVRSDPCGRYGEGIVCKAGHTGKVRMAKIKTDAWLARIKALPDWESLV